jgi:hypothetical protein
MEKQEEKITIELTEEEHGLITGVLMMHHTGLILQVKNPLIHKIARDFSLRDVRNRLKKP